MKIWIQREQTQQPPPLLLPETIKQSSTVLEPYTVIINIPTQMIIHPTWIWADGRITHSYTRTPYEQQHISTELHSNATIWWFDRWTMHFDQSLFCLFPYAIDRTDNLASHYSEEQFNISTDTMFEHRRTSMFKRSVANINIDKVRTTSYLTVLCWNQINEKVVSRKSVDMVHITLKWIKRT